MSAISLKVVVIGDSAVGKTCIALRYITEEFSSQTRPTISAGFCIAKVKCGTTDFDLCIWDTAGQEVYKVVTAQYYRDAKLALIVYDVTDRSTFQAVSAWNSRLYEANKSVAVTVLVGNKCDLPDRVVSREEAEDKAKEMGIMYRETSALTGQGIQEVFQDICEEYLRRNPGGSVPSTQGLNVNKQRGKKKCC